MISKLDQSQFMRSCAAKSTEDRTWPFRSSSPSRAVPASITIISDRRLLR